MRLTKISSTLFLIYSISLSPLVYSQELKNELPHKGSVQIFNAPNLSHPANWSTPVEKATDHTLRQSSSQSLDFSSQSVAPESLSRALEALKKKAEDKAKRTIASEATPTADFVPLCPTLEIDALYTLSGTQAGGAYCYHFTVPKRSKTTVLLVGQSSATDFILSLLHDDGQNNLAVLGSSDNPGNADEVLLSLTEPGHYYWFMEAKASDGAPFNFGASVNTDIDQYELNDVLSLSTPIPDGLHTVIANSDSNQDYDYYHFHAIRGQNVGIMLSGTANNSNHWILELLNGGQWQSLSKDSQHSIGSLVPNQRIDIRVRPNPSQLPTTQMTYLVNFGSAVVLDSHNVSGESNVIRIPYSAPTQFGYMTTQAYRELTWSARATDTKGAPIPDLTATLLLDKRVASNGQLSFTPYSQTTNSYGSASGIINLGTCSGDWRTEFIDYSQGYRNTWRTDYNAGAWSIEFDEFPSVGVGGPNVPYVTFGQLCRQTLISSEPS